MQEEIYSKYIDVKDNSVKEFNLTFNYAADYTELFKDLKELNETYSVKFNINTVNLLEMFKTFLNGVIIGNKYILPHEKVTEEDIEFLKEELQELESLLDSVTSVYGYIDILDNGTEVIVVENLDLATEEYVPSFVGRYSESKEVFYSKTGKHPSEIGVPEAD